MGQRELKNVKMLTDLLKGIQELENLARKKRARAIAIKCPHCEGSLIAGTRSDDTFSFPRDRVFKNLFSFTAA
jgi:hypothetical protein